jgi:hypothetical protein
VTAGKLTQAQADAIKKRIEDGTQPIFGGGGRGSGGPGGMFGHPGKGGPGFRRGAPRAPGAFGGFGGFGLMAGIKDVTTYLGLTPQALMTQLRSGKTLADIATAQGKTADGLKAAITSAVTTQLDAAVTAGKLSKDQETKVLAGLTAKLDDFVNGKVPMMGGFGFGGGSGHRGHWQGPGKGGKPSTPQAPPAAPAAPAAWAPAPGAA